MDAKGVCSTCGAVEPLNGDRMIRAHEALRMGSGGTYRSGFTCEGSGEATEPVEELVDATGGA